MERTKLPWMLIIAFTIVCAGGLQGCVRNAFDLCDDNPPHPDCLPPDAGTDATTDAGDSGRDR